MEKLQKHPGIYFRIGQDGKRTYYLRLIEGGRQTWRAIGPHLQEAERVRQRLKVDRAARRVGVSLPERMTFKTLAAEYLKYYQTKARESNWPRVISVFKRLNDFFGHMEIDQVTSFTVEKYIRKRQKETPAPAPGTLNNELLYLTAALNKAVEWGRLEGAPRIKTLPVYERRARILSDDELKIIIENVSEDHRDAILVDLDTGLRLRELFYLSPGNVDFKAAVIHLEDTKSGKHRSIPMTPQVAAILERRFKALNGRLFGDKDDNRLSQRFCLERKKLKGIALWRFHDLRHTFCTRLLQKGVDPFTVMKLSGHSKLEMVTRYLHTDDDLKRAAINKLTAQRPKKVEKKKGKRG